MMMMIMLLIAQGPTQLNVQKRSRKESPNDCCGGELVMTMMMMMMMMMEHSRHCQSADLIQYSCQSDTRSVAGDDKGVDTCGLEKAV